MNGNWIRRCRPGAETSRIRVVESENDFPFATVGHVRVGSAHADCRPDQEERLVQFVVWIARHINARFDPEVAEQPIRRENK